MNSVWITGAGAVSAAGPDTAALARLLASGGSAVGAAPGLEAPAGVAPEVKHARETRRVDRSAALFYDAGREAWRRAGLDDAAPAPERVAIIEGSSLGPIADLLARHRERLEGAGPVGPAALIRFMTGAGGSLLAQHVGAHGAVLHLSAGSVSATCALGEAFQRVRCGAADVVLAGGGECPLHPEIVAIFAAAGILARDGRCRPFAPDRGGTVLGEGAGALVLESEAHARARGAAPLAMVTGFGLTCEAVSMVAPAPDGAGVSRAVRLALDGAPAAGVDWIKAHGTGTAPNDLAECRGLAAVFGGRLAETPMTSLKPALGHSLGASGAVEAVAALLALEGGFVPATAGTDGLDPALPPCRVAHAVERVAARRVLMVSESFGGRCAALVMERP